jgi:glucan endo-1,3-beta-D-glucosidase
MLAHSSLISLAVLVASVQGVHQGFNYGSTFTDGSAVVEADFQSRFTTAQNLVGTSGFTSARLYTMIQAGTTNNPIEAIPAAIKTNTSLLLGLWASAGQTQFNNELAALKSAITQYGTPFMNLIAGISVGSEDLYRNSPVGVINLSGTGANPADIVSYIGQVRSAIAGTGASNAPVGHVDTWTAWVNGSNANVINACDFLGVDAYPYFQNTEPNSIDSGYDVFFQAYNNTVGVATGKPVWITETGWPVSGKTENLAVASPQNAQTYWDQVGCAIFGKINTWWFTIQDSYPTTPSPSFGIVGTTLSTTPLFNLTCPAVVAHFDNSANASSTSNVVSGSAASATASGSAISAASSGAGVEPSVTLSPSSSSSTSGASGTYMVMVGSTAVGLVIATLCLFIA